LSRMEKTFIVKVVTEELRRMKGSINTENMGHIYNGFIL